jgi:Cu(I)/Ag(I) efflux system membrane fusion protein
MKLRLPVVVLIVAGLSLVLLVQCSRPQGHEAGGAKKILYYVDPMHPAYRSDRPGIAPDCGMPLAPVYEGDEPAAKHQPGPGAATVTPEQRRLLAIRVEALKTDPGLRTLHTTGRVVPDENATYRIVAGADGLIRSLGDNAPGTMVRRNEVLARFFTSDLRATEQTYVFALQTRDRGNDSSANMGTYGVKESFQLADQHLRQESSRLAEEQLRASEGDLRVLGMGDAQLREVAKSRELARDIRITSPAEGLVLSRGVTAGQWLERGKELYRIANLERVWILADLPDNFPAPRPGDVVLVKVPGADRTLRAIVSSAVPLFDPSSRTLELRLEVPNPGLYLRPDMFVDVELTARAPPGLSAPLEAIINTGNRKIAYVETSDNVFEPRVVETGAVYGDRVVINRGLAAGDRVVTAGNFMIDSESRMKAPSAPAEVAPRAAQ